MKSLRQRDENRIKMKVLPTLHDAVGKKVGGGKNNVTDGEIEGKGEQWLVGKEGRRTKIKA